MNQEYIKRWQVEFEKADAETIRQMLAEATGTRKRKGESHITKRADQAVGGPLFSRKYQPQKS